MAVRCRGVDCGDGFFDGFVLVLFFFLLIIGRLPGCVDAESTSVSASKRRVDVGFASKTARLRRQGVRGGRKTATASAPPKAGVNATRPMLKRNKKKTIKKKTITRTDHNDNNDLN